MELSGLELALALVGVGLFGFFYGRSSMRDPEYQRMVRKEVDHAFDKVPPESLRDIDRHLKDRKKIAAIKILREETGLGLKTSKIAVEQRARQQGFS